MITSRGHRGATIASGFSMPSAHSGFWRWQTVEFRLAGRRRVSLAAVSYFFVRLGRAALLLLVLLAMLLLRADDGVASLVRRASPWGLPFRAGTTVTLGSGLHDRNWDRILDDTRPGQSTFTLAGVVRPDAAIDFVPRVASVPVVPLARGQVLAASRQCHVVLIDHGEGIWALYAHLDVRVTRDEVVSRTTMLGYTTTDVSPGPPCLEQPLTVAGRVVAHLHLAFLQGAGYAGAYVPITGKSLCGHTVEADGSLDGLAAPDGQFQVPQCPSEPPPAGPVPGVGYHALKGTIREFRLPVAYSFADGITAGPDGNLWFVEPYVNRIGRITPTGALREFNVPSSLPPPNGVSAWSGLSDIVSGPDGNLWFTEWRTGRIGRITPLGSISEFRLPTVGGILSRPQALAVGPDGNLWCTLVAQNQLARISPDGSATLIPVSGVRATPFAISAGPDGNLWFTEYGGHAIGRLKPMGAFTQFALVDPDAVQPWEITTGPDGNVWFTTTTNRIGRITPDGETVEFTLTSPASGGGDITAGPDGNLWFTEPARDRIGRITPSGGVFELALTESSLSLVHIVSGPDGNLWFTEAAANQIGQLS